MRLLVFFLLTLIPSFGQMVPEYVASDSSPNLGITPLYFRDGSNNVQYTCRALSKQPTYAWGWVAPTSGGVISTISVNTNTATITFSANHGLAADNQIIISAATTSTFKCRH